MQKAAVFVPHFHWDREWYEPFQVFRHRLVTALDTVLETAEANPDFRFTVDGQLAAVEDYLEMRPENRDRVAALVAGGQLAIGPWLILLDEFLCSGETIVRNLQMGWAAAARLGGAMPIGYLPDMFGHIAQMPQILARAGIEHAALWRGVPRSVHGHAFQWRAPDGSQVRTEFLFDGYDNGLDVLLVPDQIGRALDEYAEMTAQRWGADPVLAMAGTDHVAPDPRLASWLRRDSTGQRPITVATLAEYIHEHAHDEVPTVVTGELRSHVRGNILPGVLSVRRRLKQRMAVAERTIDHAERMSALWSARDESRFLALAWHKIIESTAHDSVVGSGTDETADQVEARLADATHIARAVRDEALAERAALVPSDGYLVANPLPFPRTALVEVDVLTPPDGTALVATAADGSTQPVQLTSVAPTVLSDERVDATQLERVLRRIHRRELFGRQIDSYELTPGSLVFHLAEVPTSGPFDLLILRREVAAAAAAHPGEWTVSTLVEARATALVPVRVPASGLASVRVEPGESAEVTFTPATATIRRLSNGLVDVVINADGTFDLTGADGAVLRGVGRLVDGGDRGDSYNYGPPAQDVLVSEPTEVAVDVLENGPLRSRVRITRRYAWPTALSPDRDLRGAETVPTPVETLVEVRAGEPFVRVSTSFLNRSADHRLRYHVPLPEPVAGSASAGQFAVTERGLTAEGGWGEYPIPTFPASSFVSAGMATVLLDHATEYEVVGSELLGNELLGNELAITLLRAIGSISVNIHPFRDEPAATEIPAPGAQELGVRIENRFAIMPSATGWRGADAVMLAEDFRNDVLVVRGSARGGGRLPDDATGVRVDGADIFVSSIRRVADDDRGAGTEVRLVAMSDTCSTARITGSFTEATTVDLLGRSLCATPVTDGLDLALGPWEIRTVVVW
jgi:mannosylglycerate hydrolase